MTINEKLYQHVWETQYAERWGATWAEALRAMNDNTAHFFESEFVNEAQECRDECDRMLGLFKNAGLKVSS